MCAHFFRVSFLINCALPLNKFCPQGFLDLKKSFKLNNKPKLPKYSTEFMFSHLPLQL